MAAYCWSSIQNINGSRFRIWKNKCITLLKGQQPDNDKIYFHPKDPYDAKCQLLIDKRGAGLKHYNDSKAFIEYSNDMDEIYEIIEEYKANKERKILIAFDDINADMLSNEKFQPMSLNCFLENEN